MVGSIDGDAAVQWGETYTLDLTHDEGLGSQWVVNWGDGATTQVDGNAESVDHVYHDVDLGQTQVSAELYAPDGQFVGFQAAEVTAGGDGSVFARKDDNSVYRLDGSQWTQLPLSFSQISAKDSTELWGLDAAGNVFVWDGVSATSFGTSQLKQVSVAADGSAWGITLQNRFVRKSGLNWASMPIAIESTGPKSWQARVVYFDDISAASGGGAHAVSTTGQFWWWNSNKWSKASGTLKDISIGGISYGVNSAGNLYQWNSAGGWSWKYKSWTKLKSVSAGSGTEFWGIDLAGAVVHWDGTQVSKVPSVTKSIDVGSFESEVATNTPDLANAEETLLETVRSKAPDAIRIELRDGAGVAMTVSGNLDWGDVRGDGFLIQESSQQPGLVTVTRDGADVLSYDYGTSLPTEMTVLVSYLAVSDNSVESVLSEDSFAIDPSIVSLLAFNPQTSSDANVRRYRSELDDLEVAAEALSAQSDPQLYPVALATTLGYTASDYFQRFNQLVDGVLADSRWQASTGIVVSASDELAFHTGGEFYFVPKDMEIRTPETLALNWSDGLASHQADRIAAAGSLAIEQTLGSIAGVQAITTSSLFANADELEHTVYQWQKAEGGGYVDLLSGSQTTSVSTEMSLPAHVEVFIEQAIDSGWTVKTLSQSTGFQGPATADQWYGIAIEMSHLTTSGVETRSLLFKNGETDASYYGRTLDVSNQAIAQALPGKVYRNDTDLVLPSIGVGVQVTRQFASDQDKDVGFGPGWTFGYGASLDLTTDGSGFTWNVGDGSQKEFSADGPTGGPIVRFIADDERGITATKQSLGGEDYYSIFLKDQTEIRFQSAANDSAHLESITDRNGNRQELIYTEDKLTAVIDATVTDFPLTRLTFTHQNERIATITDDSGRVWQYEYDSIDSSPDLLTKVTGPGATSDEQQTFEYAYQWLDELPRLISTLDTSGQETTYHYTASGRLRETNGVNGVTNHYRYDDFQSTLSVSDANGFVTKQVFDEAGRVSEVVSSAGVIDRLVYLEDENLVTQRSTVDGTTTSFEYDPRGNVVKSITDGLITETAFDPDFNQVLLVRQSIEGDSDSGRTVTTNKLDDRGNIVSSKDALGNEVTRRYTERGLLHSETSPRGEATEDAGDYTTWYQYNELGQVTDKYGPVETTPQQVIDLGDLVPSYVNGEVQWNQVSGDPVQLNQTAGQTATASVADVGPNSAIELELIYESTVAETSLRSVDHSPYVTDTFFWRGGSSHDAYRAQPYFSETNVAIGSIITASPMHVTNAVHQTHYLVDSAYGNASAFYSAGSQADITLELEDDYWIDSISFGRDRSGSYQNYEVGAFTVATSMDNVNFTQVFDSVTDGNSAVDLEEWRRQRTVEASFSPIQARYVQFQFDAAVGSPRMVIDEIEVNAAEGLGDQTAGQKLLRSVDRSEYVGKSYYREGTGQEYYRVQPFENDRNVAAGAQVTASALYGNGIYARHQVDHLVDSAYGNASSFYSAGSTADVTLELEHDFWIDSIMFGRDRWGYYGENYEVGAFTVATSLDGVSFTEVFDSAVDGNSAVDLEKWTRNRTVQASFPAVEARFVQFHFVAAAGWPRLIVDEIEVNAADGFGDQLADKRSLRMVDKSTSAGNSYYYGGSGQEYYRVQPFQNDRNVAAGAAVTATPEFLGALHHRSEFLVDSAYGNATSYYAPGTQADVTLELDHEFEIDSVQFGRDRWGYYGEESEVGAFTVSVSTDNTNFTEVFDSAVDGNSSVDLEKWTNNRTVRASFPAVSAKYIQFHFVAAAGSNRMIIDEIEVNLADGAEDPRKNEPEIRLIERSPIQPGEFFWHGGTGSHGYYAQPFTNDRNVAVGATVTASPGYGNYVQHDADFLVDSIYGNGRSYHSGESEAEVILELQKNFSIDSISFGRDRVGTYTNDYRVGEFQVFTSLDGLAFDKVFDSTTDGNSSVNLDQWSIKRTVEASFPEVEARFVKFQFVAAAGSPRVVIDEIEVNAAEGYSDQLADGRLIRAVDHSPYETDNFYWRGGVSNDAYRVQPYFSDTNIAVGASVTASAPYVTNAVHQAHYLVDSAYGNASSYYSADGQADITLELVDDYWIDSISFGRDRSGSAQNYEVGSFDVATSMDGINFTQVFDSATDSNSAVDLEYWTRQRTVQASFPAVEARHVRFQFVAAAGSPRMVIDEIEVNAAAVAKQRIEIPIVPGSNDSAGVAHETFVYDSQHNLTQYTSPEGVVAEYEYDDYGRVTRTETPDPNAGSPDATGPVVSTSVYDRFGKLLTRTEADGTVTSYTYDTAGRAETVTTGDTTTEYEYDAVGQVTLSRDEAGDETRFVYDSSGNLIASFYPDETEQHARLDVQGRLLSSRDATGSETTWIYDDQARTITITSASGGISVQQYDTLGNLISETSPSDAVTTHQYDQANRLIRSQFADQWVREVQYNADGLPTQTTVFDIAGILPENLPGDLTQLPADRVRTTGIQYDAHGQPIRWEDSLGGVSTAQYNSAGQLIAKTDARGLRQEFEIGSAGAVSTVRIVDPITGSATRVVQNVVDSSGRLVSRRSGFQAGGEAVNFTTAASLQHDPTELTTTITDLLGQTTTTDYSGDGRQTITTDSAGRIVTTLRDASGRTLSTSLEAADPNDEFSTRASTYDYDEGGRVSQWTDPLGNVSNVVYDAIGNSVTNLSPELVAGDANSRLQTTQHYNNAGQLISRVDAAGRITSYSYDSVGRLLTTTMPDPDGTGPLPSPSITNAYNGFGEIVSQTDHLGRTTYQTYDRLGRLETQTSVDPDGDGPLTPATTTRIYDAGGNVTSVTDSAGRTTSWQYDTFGRVTLETLPDPNPTDAAPAPSRSFEYNDEGRLVQTTDVTGSVTNYEYDDLGREVRRILPEASDGAARPVIERTYDDAGNVATVTDPLGATTSMSYNIAGQLTGITYPDPDGVVGPLSAPSRTYQYDDAGRVTSFTDSSGTTTDYTYDAIGRPLTQATSDPDGSGPLGEFTTTWVYDDAGNVLRTEDSLGRSATFVYDDLNREITKILTDPDRQ